MLILPYDPHTIQKMNLIIIMLSMFRLNYCDNDVISISEITCQNKPIDSNERGDHDKNSKTALE